MKRKNKILKFLVCFLFLIILLMMHEHKKTYQDLTDQLAKLEEYRNLQASHLLEQAMEGDSFNE